MLRRVVTSSVCSAARSRAANSAPARAMASAASADLAEEMEAPVAFLGLGAMGYPMAERLRQRGTDVFVWNRSVNVAEQHRRAHNTNVISEGFDELAQVRAVFLCLPTSVEVENTLRKVRRVEGQGGSGGGRWWYGSGGVSVCMCVCRGVSRCCKLSLHHSFVHSFTRSECPRPSAPVSLTHTRKAAPFLRPGTTVVDCTSGHPQHTKEIAGWLQNDLGVSMIDCAVSGGPMGARKGTLAAFVGCDDADLVRRMVPDLETFAQHIVHLGPVSSGHAVKVRGVCKNNVWACVSRGSVRMA